MPTFRELETRVAKNLEAKMVEHEKAIQAAMREALDSMYADMTKIYEKWAVGGQLTKAEMTRYNKYITMEKKMLSLVDPAIKASIAEIKRIAPEMYNASFFEYAWAMDNGNGVRLSYGQIPEAAIKKLFDPSNPKNIEIIEAIKTFPIEAKKYIRAALLKGLTTGKGYNAMAADLKDAIGNKALWRALRILRTEGQRAISMAQYDLYKKADDLGIRGIDVWDSAIDKKVRDDHKAADGQKRNKDGYFYLGPMNVPALYPLDPNLPPEQAINCRCHLRKEIEGYALQVRRSREEGIIPYQTYKEWQKEYHPDWTK